MTRFEYKVVPAPAKGKKARGAKGPEGRFANAIELLMNDMAAEGWEFQRAETLPSEERSGLTSSTTTYRSVMVFRRPRQDVVDAFAPRIMDKPAVASLPAPVVEPVAESETEDQPSVDAAEESATPADTPVAAQAAEPVEAQTPVPEPVGKNEENSVGKMASGSDVSEEAAEIDEPVSSRPEEPKKVAPKELGPNVEPPEATPPLVLTKEQQRPPTPENEPEEGATISNISVALKARARNLSQR